MENLIGIIGNLGFPIVVSLYLLIRIEDKLDHLTNSISELTRVINKLSIK